MYTVINIYSTSSRLYKDVAFIYKLISGVFIWPYVLQKTNFRVPAFNSWKMPPFLVPQYTNNL